MSPFHVGRSGLAEAPIDPSLDVIDLQHTDITLGAVATSTARRGVRRTTRAPCSVARPKIDCPSRPTFPLQQQRIYLVASMQLEWDPLRGLKKVLNRTPQRRAEAFGADEVGGGWQLIA